jgi:Lsr2
MAQKVQTLFIDDIDGGEAEGTVRFGLDGADYEIDLNAEHTEELRHALALYVAHARRVGSPVRRVARARRGGAGIDTAKVREWAKDNGYAIKNRGRVPGDLLVKYQAATAA